MKKIIMILGVALIGCSSPDSEWVCNCEQNVELGKSMNLVSTLSQYQNKVKSICELREVSTINYADTCLVIMTNMD